MRTDEINKPQRRGKRESVSKSNFLKRLFADFFICIFILIILTVVKLTPDDKFSKTKNTVSLIISQNIDIKEELGKLKNMFIPDENINSMEPVSQFQNPVPDGNVVKNFGVQDAGVSSFHYGVDIVLPDDSKVLASAAGVISEIATTEEMGSYITIKHNDQIYTTYAHLEEIIPNVGEKVSAGQPIARANNENSTIYFEIRRNDTYLDPTEFINFGV